ncbi:MAG TPA: NAD(P)H-hydrate dehydratase [Thermodesulfobacteriota bacterium]|nr:NAD(P)H-hydrate dehydratase [Thermodesulfobacteriota bacterium]
MVLTTAAQMKELDRRTIENLGLPGLVLMENAARGAVQVLLKEFPQARSIAVLCGKGNNGGDGLAMARYFQSRGLSVQVFLAGARKDLKGDAAQQLHWADSLGVPVVELTGPGDPVLNNYLPRADLLVDALLGTGLENEVRGIFRDIITRINKEPIPKAAIDIPSGLSSDTGRPLGLCVEADLTVTFGLPKIGQVLFPGSRYAGRLFVIDIGIPPVFWPPVRERVELLESADLAAFLPKREPDGHKGSYGHVYLLAGSKGKTGAAAMSSLGALRAGAGLVTLGIPESLNPILEIKLTEAMTDPLPEGEAGYLGAKALDQVLYSLKGKKGLALGPGLSTSEGTRELVRAVIKNTQDLPLVIDADGLNILAESRDLLPHLSGRAILTPHPGEMARLSGESIGDIQSSRIESAREFSNRYGVIVVLKGARTIIADPVGPVYVNPAAHSVLAAGGTGDVLTGLILGLVSQGLPLIQAACLGVFLHGQAGIILAREKGDQGILASELLEVIPRLLSEKESWAGWEKEELPLIREINL